MLRKQSPKLRLIVSYSDLKQGHIGAIYQAGNWTYQGWTPARPPPLMIEGKALHGRSVRSKYGRNDLKWLREHIDPNACKLTDAGCHRYALALDKSLQPMLDKMAKPYPKRRQDSREPSANQADEGGAAPPQALQ